MIVHSLCYHDVVADDPFDSSGFPGSLAASYKLREEAFRRHLEAIQRQVTARRGARRPSTVLDLRAQGRPACLLTFDDGGASAHSTIAPLLENFGWRGHFFIPTDYIDAPGFLSRAQIRELRSRGHVIGSHSCTHRGRMSAQPAERLVLEWGISRDILSGLLGEEVNSAAVPYGYYSRRVAEAAAVAGIKALFTLEATAAVESHGGCLIFGRYLVKRSASAAWAARLAIGSRCPCTVERLSWNAKKVARAGLGGLYPRMREAYLSWQRFR